MVPQGGGASAPGRVGRGRACWRRILSLQRPEQFSSVDQGIYGHLTRRNLAALAAERGDHAEAGAALGRSAGRMPRRPRGAGEATRECIGDRQEFFCPDPIVPIPRRRQTIS